MKHCAGNDMALVGAKHLNRGRRRRIRVGAHKRRTYEDWPQGGNGQRSAGEEKEQRQMIGQWGSCRRSCTAEGIGDIPGEVGIARSKGKFGSQKLKGGITRKVSWVAGGECNEGIKQGNCGVQEQTGKMANMG